MLKGKALRRAIRTKDVLRVYNNDVPLITDTTELITPEIAEAMLQRNKKNRPLNWNKVDEYKSLMERGEWKFHAQGIIIDKNGNIATGQKRLWAIILSRIEQYMRVSRGSPPDTVQFIDRGVPQSSRDLATRRTERKHSPTEASIVRAFLALKGNIKPSLDEIAEEMVIGSDILSEILKKARRIKKTKSLLMILGGIYSLVDDYREWNNLLAYIEELSKELECSLLPMESSKCWNRGAAFNLAMEKAKKICESRLERKQ